MSAHRLSFVALTALLWFVPSIGTHGMGMIGQRASHADAFLIDARAADDRAAGTLLTRADAVVEASIGL